MKKKKSTMIEHTLDFEQQISTTPRIDEITVDKGNSCTNEGKYITYFIISMFIIFLSKKVGV